MKKSLIPIILFISFFSTIIIVYAANFSEEVSTCDAESNENTANTFGQACDSTDGSNLESDDGTVETHSYSKNKYAGVRIQTVNTTIIDCESISEVYFCHERWTESGDTLQNCDVSVDADGGSSYTDINSTCPGTSANPGMTCQNVTSDETWTCANFFDASGTRAVAKSELSRSNAGGASTASWDVFFFNITYTQDTTNPSVTIDEPQNQTYTTTSQEINFTATDAGTINTCVYTDNSGTTNTTLTNCVNTTYTASQGSTTITLYVNDSANNKNETESVTFFVDSISPTIDFVSPSETNGSFKSINDTIINVTSTDSHSLSNITIRLYNSTHDEIENNVSATSPFYINYSSLSDGIYYFNSTSKDALGNKNDSTTRNITIDTTNPLISFGTGTENNHVNKSQTDIYINVSVTETNEDTITFYLFNSTDQVNSTLFTTPNRTINFTSLEDETYTYNVTINDSAGNSNTTTTRTITLDTKLPLVDYGSASPGNDSHLKHTSLFINVSITEPNEKNITFTLYNDTNTLTQVNQTTYTTAQRTINWTGLAEGRYYYNITVFDYLDNQNTSETRTAVIDTTSPLLTLNAPDNDTITLKNETLINITVEDNRNEIIVRIYGSNETGFNSNESLIYKKEGVSNGTIITYNWTAPVLNVTPDTILLMHFDDEFPENATFSYDETGINNGTKKASGEPTWNSSGKLGYSIKFDGSDDELSISDSDSLDLNLSFSISFWIKLTDLTKNQTLLTKGSGSVANYYVDFKTGDDNQIEFGFYNGAFRSIVVNASSIKTNQWHHIITTLNDTSNVSTVYIDNIEKGNSQLDYDVPANTLDLKIGNFPGYDQNFSGLIDELSIFNKTLSPSEIVDMFQINEGDWYWRVDLNDTASNLNSSLTRTFTIGPIWTMSPTDFGSVSSALNVNITAGILTLNNTHGSKNVTLNITHDFSGEITFNETLPITLNNTDTTNNTGYINITITSPSTEGSTTITFNITANDTNAEGSSLPASRTISVIIAATSSNPLLISAFETIPSTVSQNNSGISLKASVVNRGQGNAQNVDITFELPEGWSNSSEALTQTIGILTVNEEVNKTLTVDINSTATSGDVILYANISGKNSTGSVLGTNLLTIGNSTVTVNAISGGEGPSASTTTETGGAGPGGSGGGGSSGTTSSGGISTSPAFSETIEIIRGLGGEATFNISISPAYINTSLSNLTLIISGYPEQYIEISPEIIKNLLYNQIGEFEITLSAPSYSPHEEYNLTGIISGVLTLANGNERQYRATYDINLLIQSVALSPVENLLSEARNAIEEMENSGFNTEEVNKLFKQALQKLEQKKNHEAQELAEKIIEIKKLAFKTDSLISKILEVLDNPRKISLITGNVPREFVNEQGDLISTGSLLTGNAILEKASTLDILNLARAAFKRGDYERAEELTNQAQISLILAIKGNFGLFLYLYWYFVLLGIAVFSASGLLGYKRYQKSSITTKIENLNKEQDNAQKLIIANQQNYFTGKTSSTNYHKRESQHRKRLSQIHKRRINLRNRRVRLLKPQQLVQDLKIEMTQIEAEIKKIQKDYFVEKSIPETAYKLMFESLNERIAELEGEKTTLHIQKKDKEKIKIKKKNSLFNKLKNSKKNRREIKEKEIKEKIKKILDEKKK